MRWPLLLLAACAIQPSWRPAAAADNDPKLVLPAIADAAERFAATAPNYTALETLSQRAIEPRPKSKQAQQHERTFRTRRIASFYGFAHANNSPALHEIRQLVAVDGRPTARSGEARKFLCDVLSSHDDALRRKMQDEFVKEGLAGVATDFGQLILLFGKDSIRDFAFRYEGNDTIGSMEAQVFSFTQQTGREGVRIDAAGKKQKQPLRGKIWVRLPDRLPLRLTLTTARSDRGIKIRDEAEVDYGQRFGVLLPALITHRRFENEDIVVQDVFEYSDWQPVTGK